MKDVGDDEYTQQTPVSLLPHPNSQLQVSDLHELSPLNLLPPTGILLDSIHENDADRPGSMVHVQKTFL